jgi:hypothetical protein
MSEYDRLADDYIAAWNERDADRRRELIAQTWTEDARYVDPIVAGEGHDGIDAMIAGVLAQAEGHAFRRTSPVDAHHDRVRFGWDLVNVETGVPFMAGLDIGEVAPDGRLRSIVGFLDLVPDLGGAGAA